MRICKYGFSVAGWLPLTKELLIRLTVCYFCIMVICSFGYFSFGVEGLTLVLIALLACAPFSFSHYTHQMVY